MILDTNALSAYADGDSGAIESIARTPIVAIPVIVIGEYLFGISQSRQRIGYERWMNGFVGASRTLEITAETAAMYAEIRSEVKRSGTPIPSNDVWIAALCREHAMPLLSKDRHFDVVKGIRRIEW